MVVGFGWVGLFFGREVRFWIVLELNCSLKYQWDQVQFFFFFLSFSVV